MTPMSKTLTPSTAKFVTTHDPKGLKFLEVAGAAYNKAAITEAEAQCVNEATGLTDLIAGHIAQHRHEVSPILKLVVSGVQVAGAKCFVPDKVALKEANVGFTDSNFDQFFLGKVEDNIKDATLAVHRLEKNSLDAEIRKELDQEREEITLTHFFDLLKKQSKGQKGHLLINGYANIAYICDKDGKLWAVNAYWYSVLRYWRVFAHSVGSPLGWRVGL